MPFSPRLCYNIFMIKIWIKTLKDNKIVKQAVLKSDEKFDYADFHAYVYEACRLIDEPSPVIVKTHIFNYAKFNYVKFFPDDFLEEVSFDKMILENINR